MKWPLGETIQWPWCKPKKQEPVAAPVSETKAEPEVPYSYSVHGIDPCFLVTDAEISIECTTSTGDIIQQRFVIPAATKIFVPDGTIQRLVWEWNNESKKRVCQQQ